MSANRRQAYRYAVAAADAGALLRISEGEVPVRIVDTSAAGFKVAGDRELAVQEGEIAGLTTPSEQSICRVTWVEYEAGGTSVGLQRISEVVREPQTSGNAGLIAKWFGNSVGTMLLLVAFGTGLGMVMGFTKFRPLPGFPIPSQRVPIQDIPRAPGELATALARSFNSLDDLKSRQFVKKLHLTDGQQRRVDTIVDKLVLQLASVHLDRSGRSPEMSSHMGLLMIRRAWTQVEDILTPEQISLWDSLLEANTPPAQQAGL